MDMTLQARPRTEQGRSASRHLRRAGRVPGIVYGGDSAPAMIDLDHNDLYHKLQHEAFHAAVLTLETEGRAAEKVLLRDVQYHAYKPLVRHVDLQRVNEKEKLHVKVPLHFVNAEVSPGVKLAHGIVNQIVTEVDVRCYPKDLPEFIEVDLSGLQANHSYHLSEIRVPDGVELTDLLHGDDKAVVTITAKGGATADAGDTENAGEE